MHQACPSLTAKVLYQAPQTHNAGHVWLWVPITRYQVEVNCLVEVILPVIIVWMQQPTCCIMTVAGIRRWFTEGQCNIHWVYCPALVNEHVLQALRFPRSCFSVLRHVQEVLRVARGAMSWYQEQLRWVRYTGFYHYTVKHTALVIPEREHLILSVTNCTRVHKKICN